MIKLTPFERLLHATLVKHIRATTPGHTPVDHNPVWVCITRPALEDELRVLKDGASAQDGDARSLYVEPGLERLTQAIGHVSMYEVQHGRPMLGALVVADDQIPDLEALAALARHLNVPVVENAIEEFWLRQLDDLIRFWASEDLVLVVDAAVDRLAADLADIKTLVRRMANATRSS